MANNLLIRNVRPMGGPATDVLIRNGRIERIGLATDSAGAEPEPEVETLDGEGGLLLPGLVDGHMHLDKTFLGLPWVSHQAGPTTFDRIEAEQRMQEAMELSVEKQAGNLIRRAISKGTTHIRTHVDVDPGHGLSRFEALLAARQTFRDAVSIQLVAFPQQGVIRKPGTAELLEEAARSGADAVGGIDPAGLDRDAAGQLNIVFAIAERHGVGVDIHLHDPGELGFHQIQLIAERTREHGLEGKVVISHAYALGSVEEARRREAVDLLAETGVSIMTTAPAHSPVPPIQQLHEAGVPVFSGSDGVRDAWTPFGSADMLERAMLVGLRFNFRTDEGLKLAFHLASQGGAQALALEDYGLEAGCAGDAVLVEAENLMEAVVNRPVRKLVVKNGRVVARNGEAPGEKPEETPRETPG